MVQSVDFRPVYSAVNIQIRKPEVDAGNAEMSVVADNGIYNAVKIGIDNPKVNTRPKEYDYPENDNIVTYNTLPLNTPKLPKGFPVATAYYESSVVIPEEQEVVEEAKTVVPAPNFTTTENEKGKANLAEADKDEHLKTAEVKKKPEIVPSVDIKPEINIEEVVSKLENSDFDVQAEQMEKITKTAMTEPEKARVYIVRDVFTSLIEITKKDTSKLPAPNEKQIEARKKIISNYIASKVAAEQNKEVKLPYDLTEDEIKIATQISPMEQAERNKEYAMYTIAALAKIYTDDVAKQTGNVVPFTDVPGISDIVDALRHSSNPGVKTAAIDSLVYLNRPEYKDEISSIFQIVKQDENSQIAKYAEKASELLNK